MKKNERKKETNKQNKVKQNKIKHKKKKVNETKKRERIKKKKEDNNKNQPCLPRHSVMMRLRLSFKRGNHCLGIALFSLFY